MNTYSSLTSSKGIHNQCLAEFRVFQRHRALKDHNHGNLINEHYDLYIGHRYVEWLGQSGVPHRAHLHPNSMITHHGLTLVMTIVPRLPWSVERFHTPAIFSYIFSPGSRTSSWSRTMEALELNSVWGENMKIVRKFLDIIIVAFSMFLHTNFFD